LIISAACQVDRTGTCKVSSKFINSSIEFESLIPLPDQIKGLFADFIADTIKSISSSLTEYELRKAKSQKSK
jgi:hypothetical protein